MEILLCILGVVASVMIYDFYASRKWQLVTSAIRNDLVFENRNKSYGAYTLRRDYDRNMLYIMLGVVLSVGVLFGAFYFLRANTLSDVTTDIVEPNDPGIELNLNTKDVTIKKPTEKTTPEKQPDPTEKNLAPLVTDSIPSGPVKVPDPNVKAGTVTQPGGGTGGTGLVTTPQTPTKIDSIPAIPPIVDMPDVDPKYKGNLPKDIVDELEYPEIAIERQDQGKCYLKFVVNLDGTVSNVTVVRGVPNCPECDKEAMRVVKTLKKWEPAVHNNKKVRSTISLPINFVLE